MDRRKFLKISGLGVGGSIITGLGLSRFEDFGSKENLTHLNVKELTKENKRNEPK